VVGVGATGAARRPSARSAVASSRRSRSTSSPTPTPRASAC
jgi:hypothetical protein